MKMNKIIIPAAMLAVGVALVGSVSSTLAWYQYSTKAQAAFIGTSVGQSENLEIQKSNTKWTSNLPSAEVELLANASQKNLIPVTPGIAAANGNMGKDDALPAIANFHNSIETGVAGYGTNRTDVTANVIQFILNIRYRKTADEVSYEDKTLKLVDLTIIDSTANNQVNQGDLYKAVRVHFSAGDNHRLYANDETNIAEQGNEPAYKETITTNTYGFLDTVNNGQNGQGEPIYDKGAAYEWEDASQNNVMYGVENSQQVAYNSKNESNLDWTIGTLPEDDENGLAVTVTIWLEGWQKLSGIPSGNADNSGEGNTSAMWDPLKYANKKFNVGMRFKAE